MSEYHSKSLLRFGLFALFLSCISCFPSTVVRSQNICYLSSILGATTSTTHLYSSNKNDSNPNYETKQQSVQQNKPPPKLLKRKDLYKYMANPIVTTSSVSLLSMNKAAIAETTYPIQKSDEEWQEILSPKQYGILRKGGTEKPYSSILEKETRNGVYKCAGCDTPLFLSKDKFKSGTGWPSFASAIEEGVEIDNVSDLRMNLVGAELRCKGCGGHLGDVFNDGFLFVGTPAFKTGKRFCIDGYALVFYTKFGLESVRGDA